MGEKMKKHTARKPNGKYRIIMMWAGYAESGTTSCLIYVSGERFKTKTDAVRVLAVDMYHKYVNDVNPPRYGQQKTCCASANDDASNVFCPKCGNRLETVSTFDDDEFRAWVVSLFATDANSYGESDGTAERDFVFFPWDADDIVGAKENEVVVLRERAEDTLAEALYDQLPELMSKEVKETLSDKLSSDTQQTEWQVMKIQEQQ